MDIKKKQKTEGFHSHWGFILASVGSAVGMANVWGFGSVNNLVSLEKNTSFLARIRYR